MPSVDAREADEVIVVDTERVCPDCQVSLDHFDIRDRSATEVEPVEVKKVVYKLTHRKLLFCIKMIVL